jgi:predicted Zn-dependent protease
MNERIERLKSFLADTPNDPFLNHAMALELVKEGDDLAASFYFNKNLENAPNYVATYYHLAKTMERMDNKMRALEIYEEGMKQAKLAADQHSYNELLNAYEDLAY